ncbi:MAG: glycerol acyltransferase [Syntrophaceae bacterium]|nr:glycerol acyltransferase [Syntrophaceae bacterium]
MPRTMFDTPVVKQVFYFLSLFLLRAAGWKKEGDRPEIPKYVVIAAPHTSNWDFPLTLMLAFAFRLKVYWMGKHTLFRGIMGPICRWLGGIEVDRTRSTNLVAQSIERFRISETMAMIIPPEGTRKKVRYWKTGFYHIAHGAGVPIVLGFMDYRRKVGGLGPLFHPTGNIDRDMAEIQKYYEGVTGRKPDQWNHESITAGADRSGPAT